MANFTIFETLGNSWENGVQNVVGGAVSSLTASLTPVITTGVIIYFMITGFMIVSGRIQEPIGDVVIKFSKIAIIMLIFSNAQSLVTDATKGLEGLFTNAVGGGTNIYQLFDLNLEKGFEAAKKIQIRLSMVETNLFGGDSFAKTFFTGLMLIISWIVVVISTVSITVIGACIFMMSKVGIQLAIAFSPFFIAGLFFPLTARWFDSWLSQLLNFTLTIAIVAFFSSLSFGEFVTTANNIADIAENDGFVAADQVIRMLAIVIVSFYGIKQATSIASGFTGGIGLNGVSLVGMAVAAKQMASYGFKGAKLAANTATLGMFQQTTKRDHNTGMAVTTSRLNHLREGRTLLNKNYRDAGAARRQAGWQSAPNQIRKK